MVSTCLNLACQTPFSHAADGRFFEVDRELLTHSDHKRREHRTEQYWLCGTCCQFLKVVVENGSIMTVPMDREVTSLAG
jgi:hypothetical protein